jgi:hypothetical protein
MSMTPAELKRWQRAHLRKLMLEMLDNVDWEGKTQPEILDISRDVAYEYLHGLYDWVSTMFSRFLRTVATIDPETGKRVRGMLRDSEGKYWRRETVMRNPALFEDCLKVRDALTGDDVDARNRLAEEAEEKTGKHYPKIRLVVEQQLTMNLYPMPTQSCTLPKEA